MRAPESITDALERWSVEVSQEVIGRSTTGGGQSMIVASYAIAGVGVLVWTSEDPTVFTLSRATGDATIAIKRLDWFCAAAVVEQARHHHPKP